MAKKKSTSPKGGKRGCLCDDGTYNSKCCDGETKSQGIGNTTEQGVSVKKVTREVRIKSINTEANE